MYRNKMKLLGKHAFDESDASRQQFFQELENMESCQGIKSPDEKKIIPIMQKAHKERLRVFREKQSLIALCVILLTSITSVHFLKTWLKYRAIRFAVYALLCIVPVTCFVEVYRTVHYSISFEQDNHLAIITFGNHSAKWVAVDQSYVASRRLAELKSMETSGHNTISSLLSELDSIVWLTQQSLEDKQAHKKLALALKMTPTVAYKKTTNFHFRVFDKDVTIPNIRSCWKQNNLRLTNSNGTLASNAMASDSLQRSIVSQEYLFYDRVGSVWDKDGIISTTSSVDVPGDSIIFASTENTQNKEISVFRHFDLNYTSETSLDYETNSSCPATTNVLYCTSGNEKTNVMKNPIIKVSWSDGIMDTLKFWSKAIQNNLLLTSRNDDDSIVPLTKEWNMICSPFPFQITPTVYSPSDTHIVAINSLLLTSTNDITGFNRTVRGDGTFHLWFCPYQTKSRSLWIMDYSSTPQIVDYSLNYSCENRENIDFIINSTFSSAIVDTLIKFDVKNFVLTTRRKNTSTSRDIRFKAFPIDSSFQVRAMNLKDWVSYRNTTDKEIYSLLMMYVQSNSHHLKKQLNVAK